MDPRRAWRSRLVARPPPAERQARTAALAAATSVFGVRASAAQTTATVDVGVSTVRYDGFLASAAGSLTPADRKSTRLNSSHTVISYAVFCLKKKKREYRC